MMKWLRQLFCRHKKYPHSRFTIDGGSILRGHGIKVSLYEKIIMCTKCGKVFD
jgi:hypothetical protein